MSYEVLGKDEHVKTNVLEDSTLDPPAAGVVEIIDKAGDLALGDLALDSFIEGVVRKGIARKHPLRHSEEILGNS